MKKKFIFIVLAVSLMTWSYTAFGYIQESDTFYYDKLFNKTFHLTPSNKEIVVVFNEGTDFRTVHIKFNVKETQILDTQKRIGIYCPAGLFSIEHTIDMLNADPAVKKAAPAYVDHEGFTKYCVPTELTVRFKDGVDTSRMMEIISQVGSEVVRKQWTPGYFYNPCS